ncbi:hypothetical protein PInf_004435 [Phytophthora infestans]|nr:hypothetical protein PInf_004435 [Phytophthora infestans]
MRLPRARGSKLRASRVRRQRDRERSLDEDELEQRFGRANLSLSAPVFVPAARAHRPVDACHSQAIDGLRDGATWSFFFYCFDVSSRRPKRSATAAASAKTAQKHRGCGQEEPAAVSAADESSCSSWSAKDVAVSMRERHRRKLSLTSTELQAQETTPEVEVGLHRQQNRNADDVYPEAGGSAFPQQLTLFSQQKRLPQRVASRDDVIDTIFKALFARSEGRRNRPRQALSAFGDDTGTDTDEPNEEFVKRGLANALFRDQLNLHAPSSLPTAVTPATAADSLITPPHLCTL